MWLPRPGQDLAGASARWIQGVWDEMRPYVTGGAYVNCADPDLADWPRAYYGANFPRLLEVKARYDPDDFFHHAQSIPVQRGP